MVNLSQLEYLIKVQKDELQSLKSIVDACKKARDNAKSLLDELIALNYRTELGSADKSLQEAERKYNGHLELYKEKKIELKWLNIACQKAILAESLRAFSLFNNTKTLSIEEIETVKKDFESVNFQGLEQTPKLN